MGGRIKRGRASRTKQLKLEKVLVAMAQDLGDNHAALSALIMATLEFCWANQVISPCHLAYAMARGVANVTDMPIEALLSHLMTHTENHRQRSDGEVN